MSSVTGASAQAAEVQWALSRHAARLLTLALTGLVIAVVTGRPQFAGAAAPALLVLLAWRPGGPPRPARIGLELRLTARQVVEGDQAAVVVVLSGYGDYTPELRIRAAAAITPGAPVTDGTSVRLPFRVERWGQRQVGSLEIILRDRWRLARGTVTAGLPRIDCNPRPARQESKILLSRLPGTLGEHPARMTGAGIEFTGVREFVPGDRQRRINWPATTRRGTLQLNTFAAERAQNVVAIVDASSDVGEPGSSSIDLAYRAASGTIRAYLAARDRVGLIIFAGRLSWIGPGTGERHFRRLLDLMLASQGGWDRAARLTRLPRAALPPGALIMVFSPLLDPRLVEALRDLRERGFAVLVVDILNAEPVTPPGLISDLTRRIWRMEQEAMRFSLTELGIPVVHWDGQQSLDESLVPYTRKVMVTRR